MRIQIETVAPDVVAQQPCRCAKGIELRRDTVDQRSGRIDARRSAQRFAFEQLRGQSVFLSDVVLFAQQPQSFAVAGVVDAGHASEGGVDLRPAEESLQFVDRFETGSVGRRGILLGHHPGHAAEGYVDLVLQQCGAGAAAARAGRTLVHHAAVDSGALQPVGDERPRDSGADDDRLCAYVLPQRIAIAPQRIFTIQ